MRTMKQKILQKPMLALLLLTIVGVVLAATYTIQQIVKQVTVTVLEPLYSYRDTFPVYVYAYPGEVRTGEEPIIWIDNVAPVKYGIEATFELEYQPLKEMENYDISFISVAAKKVSNGKETELVRDNNLEDGISLKFNIDGSTTVKIVVEYKYSVPHDEEAKSNLTIGNIIVKNVTITRGKPFE